MNPSDDPNWEHYVNTRLEIFADRSEVIDLTKGVTPQALGALERHGVGPTFAVVTACNPRGQAANEVSNQRLTRQLGDDLSAGGWTYVPADGTSPNAAHREAGFAVSLPKSDAVAIAQRYNQSAFYWFDGASMWIVGAVVATSDIRLPACVSRSTRS